MSENRTGVIYTLRDPRDYAVRYVGRSVAIDRRYYAHLFYARRGPLNNYCSKWVRVLLDLGLRPVLDVLETCEADHLSDREVWWIQRLRSEGSR